MISFLITDFNYFPLLLLLQYSHTYEYNFSKIKIVTEKLQIHSDKKIGESQSFYYSFELVLVLHLNDYLICSKYLSHFFIWNVIINTSDTFIRTFYLHFSISKLDPAIFFVIASISSKVKFVFIFLSTASSKEPILLID